MVLNPDVKLQLTEDTQWHQGYSWLMTCIFMVKIDPPLQYNQKVHLPGRTPDRSQV